MFFVEILRNNMAQGDVTLKTKSHGDYNVSVTLIENSDRM